MSKKRKGEPVIDVCLKRNIVINVNGSVCYGKIGEIHPMILSESYYLYRKKRIEPADDDSRKILADFAENPVYEDETKND